MVDSSLGLENDNYSNFGSSSFTLTIKDPCELQTVNIEEDILSSNPIVYNIYN